MKTEGVSGSARGEPDEKNPAAALLVERREQAALRLLRVWMDDESGYDEAVWPTLQKTLEENRLATRKRFDE